MGVHKVHLKKIFLRFLMKIYFSNILSNIGKNFVKNYNFCDSA